MEVGGWQQMKVQGVRGLCKCKKYIYIYLKGRPDRGGIWEIWSGFLCISHVPDINLDTEDNGEQGRQVFTTIELTA